MELTVSTRTGSSRWKECNHRSHDNLQHDLADRRMANPVYSVFSHHISKERQPAAVPDLPNDQPYQSPKKVMLKIIMNRLKPQAEKTIAGEVSYLAGALSPQRITSGLNTNFILSPRYSFHKSLHHKSYVFVAYVYSAGTQLGNLHLAR